jgi:peptidoglycan/xylan/chitin deacetylase (PgdA/CDA1 family)
MKRRLKLVISLIVRGWDIIHDAFCRLLRSPLPGRCMVLYYHAVPAHHRELFARQLDAILQCARPIPSNPAAPLTPGFRYVSITFDDGFVSVLQNAAPELARRRIPWTIFVPSGCLGRQPDWLRSPHAAARQDRVMTSEELRKLIRDPLVTVASHTVNHTNLLEVDSHRAFEELARSRADLEAVVGRPVVQFSYPFGARTAALDQQARAAGYTRVFCSDPVHAFRSNNEAATGRASVDPDMPRLEFRLKLLGAYRWHSLLHR